MVVGVAVVVGAMVVGVGVAVVVGAMVVGVAVVVGAMVVGVGVAVVVGAMVVGVAVVVGATVVVGALGAAVSVAPPEQAETNTVRTRNPATARFMIRVCHPRRSGTQ
jgi:hypothetical protein